MDLPPLLRGACVAALPPGALLPLTAFSGALFLSVMVRSVYDVRSPLPVGDEREGGRHMLQWSSVIGLTVVLYFLLQACAGHFLVPAPDRLGRWLQVALVLYGGALALRSAVRIQATMFRREAALTPSIEEVDRRVATDEANALPPMRTLEASVPDRPLVTKSNLPGFLVGVLLMGVALRGWDMASLCLFRLPK